MHDHIEIVKDTMLLIVNALLSSVGAHLWGPGAQAVGIELLLDSNELHHLQGLSDPAGSWMHLLSLSLKSRMSKQAR